VTTGHANLIDGSWSRSAGGGSFDLRGAGEVGEAGPWLGSWPTSGSADVEAALAVLRAAPAEPVSGDVLGRAARLLTRDDAAAEALATRLGLTAAECGPHREARAPGPSPAAGESSGVAVLLPHWSALLAGPFEAAACELARGRAVLLAADARLPAAVDHVAAALLSAGVAPDRLAVLHGLTREGIEAALGAQGVCALAAQGDLERIAWLRGLATRRAIPVPELELLRAGASEVSRGDDLAAAARRIVDEAFGRSLTLSGQRAGALGRVHCDERVFSAFTHELLDALASSPDARDPLPLIDAPAAERMRRLGAMGLDEGATCIAGGTEAERPRLTSRRVLPAVFTNVTPGMAFVRRQPPARLLCLLRAPRRG
jgi:acyl-CoA reductase-like NAD-dependent aldehyde dehydrogenase